MSEISLSTNELSQNYLDHIRNRYLEIKQKIEEAAKRAGRDAKEITLVAVSKKQPIEKIIAYQTVLNSLSERIVFGENYVQEFVKKKEQLIEPYEVHLIGPLQSNKAKYAPLFSMVESVHSLKIAHEINKAAAKENKIVDILLEVNISNDPAKSGFTIEQLQEAINGGISKCDNLRCLGLMSITAFYEDSEAARNDFCSLKRVIVDLRNKTNLELKHLSMGMSQDYEIAIEEGATIVRIGTALFGERQ